jgi:hypothetical protein
MPPVIDAPVAAPAQQFDVVATLMPEPLVRPVVDRHRTAAV